MSTTAIHFLKITGNLAAEALTALEAIRLRCPSKNNSMGSHLWHARDRMRIDHLGLALMSVARSLPVVWYSQYVDGYFMGSAAPPPLGWPDDVHRAINSQNTGIVYFPASVLPATLQQIKRSRKTFAYNLHLRMCIEELSWAKGEPLVIVITECLGGSLLDTDVHIAGETPLRSLLDATKDRVPAQTDGRQHAGFARRMQNMVKKFREQHEGP